jgi:hypothetical protein
LLKFVLDTNQVIIHKFFLFRNDNKVGNPVFLKLIKTDAHGNNMFIVLLLERHAHLFAYHVEIKHSEGVDVLETNGVVVFDTQEDVVFCRGFVEFGEVVDGF